MNAITQAVTALARLVCHAAKAFVEQTADADQEATTHHKAPFSVRQGATSGTQRLTAKAVAARAS
jgi:hypothetical protein